MRKILKPGLFCVIFLSVFCAGILRDRAALNRNILRLHVVAASDSREDQEVKLQVRDAILDYCGGELASVQDPEAAKVYLLENLSAMEAVANDTLRNAGFPDTARVTLCREAFDTRHYDTFSLPAGVYESLRVTIGPGQGHNWWCVVFPTLCLPETSEGFEEVAAEAGMEAALACALAGEEGYEVRFFLLDVLGRLENMWFEG